MEKEKSSANKPAYKIKQKIKNRFKTFENILNTKNFIKKKTIKKQT